MTQMGELFVEADLRELASRSMTLLSIRAS
jgi:hypothetical protein